MMYEHLVKNLRDDTALQNCEFDFVHAWMHEAADAIEELQKQRDEWESHAALAESFAQGWIPVTERLPEDRQRVLVFYWLNLKPKEPWHKVCYFASKLNKVDKYDFDGCNYPGFYDCDSEYGYYQLSDVTHWMPLPEPPDHIGDVTEMVAIKKCIDCQRDCQMIGCDMKACASYEPPKDGEA